MPVLWCGSLSRLSPDGGKPSMLRLAIYRPTVKTGILKGGIIVSIEKLEELKYSSPTSIDFHWDLVEFMKYTISVFKSQSKEIADLRKELAKKEDAIDIGDVIKEARLRNG